MIEKIDVANQNSSLRMDAVRRTHEVNTDVVKNGALYNFIQNKAMIGRWMMDGRMLAMILFTLVVEFCFTMLYLRLSSISTTTFIHYVLSTKFNWVKPSTD